MRQPILSICLSVYMRCDLRLCVCVRVCYVFVGVMCVVICNMPGLILNSSQASFALGLGLWVAGCHAGSVMDDIMLLFMLGQSGVRGQP